MGGKCGKNGCGVVTFKVVHPERGILGDYYRGMVARYLSYKPYSGSVWGVYIWDAFSKGTDWVDTPYLLRGHPPDKRYYNYLTKLVPPET